MFDSYFLSRLEALDKFVPLSLSQERLLTLKKQSAQITQQVQREKESFLKERSNLESMLQRVWQILCSHVRAVLCINDGKSSFLCLYLSARRKKAWLCWKENTLASPVDGVSPWERLVWLADAVVTYESWNGRYPDFNGYDFLFRLLGFSLFGWCVLLPPFFYFSQEHRGTLPFWANISPFVFHFIFGFHFFSLFPVVFFVLPL